MSICASGRGFILYRLRLELMNCLFLNMYVYFQIVITCQTLLLFLSQLLCYVCPACPLMYIRPVLDLCVFAFLCNCNSWTCIYLYFRCDYAIKWWLKQMWSYWLFCTGAGSPPYPPSWAGWSSSRSRRPRSKTPEGSWVWTAPRAQLDRRNYDGAEEKSL